MLENIEYSAIFKEKLNKMEMGSITDVINLVVVAVTLVYNQIKNFSEKRGILEREKELEDLKKKNLWFSRLIISNLDKYDSFFREVERLSLEICSSSQSELIKVRRKYNRIRDEFNQNIVNIKSFDTELYEKINMIIENLENEVFKKDSSLEKIQNFHICFTKLLIDYEKNEYKIWKREIKVSLFLVTKLFEYFLLM